MGIQLTESQRAVVEDQGGSLLVSAAAGSGKTRVLVDRLFRRVLGEEQANMDDFLIITYTRAAAADLIGKRAMSRRDLERKLQEKGASETEARYAAEWLEAIGALNDAEYAAALVRHYSRLGYGPARVREKLYEKGVPRELWEGALEELPADGGQVDAFLRSKLRGRPPDEKEKRRLTNALLRRGFPWGEVKAAWRRLGEEMQED